jgi:hypothetical protein
MVRVAGLVLSNAKALILLALLAALIAGGLTLSRQLGASATGTPGTPRTPSVIPVTNNSAASPGPSSDDEGFIHTNVSSASNNGSGTASVTVNGQSVTVPKNGSTSQMIDNGNGTSTTVHIQSHNSQAQGSAGNSSHSSVNVNVYSGSTSVSQEDSL